MVDVISESLSEAFPHLQIAIKRRFINIIIGPDSVFPASKTYL